MLQVLPLAMTTAAVVLVALDETKGLILILILIMIAMIILKAFPVNLVYYRCL